MDGSGGARRLFALLLLLPGPVFCQMPETQVPNRLLARDAVHYLDISAEQARTLNAIHASWQEYLATTSVRAADLDSRHAVEARRTPPDAAQKSRLGAALATMCEQSRGRQQKFWHDSRAVLTPPQLTRLATLEQAYSLMPIVQSAQSVGLIPDVLTAPPAGMPGGKLEVEFTYVRASLSPLPGCRSGAQTIRSGPAPAQQSKPAVP